MAYSYRFKVRIPLPRRPDKILSFGLVLPFKSRKFSLGRYGVREFCLLFFLFA